MNSIRTSKLLLYFLFFTTFHVFSQDTLRITLPQAEDQFTKNNLQLLALKLGVNENKAYELQASLRPNPTAYLEHMPYDFYNKKAEGFFTGSSEQVIQVQQLLEVAGKRGKRVNLAKLNTEQAQNQLLSVLRDLQYSLRITFYDLYYQQQQLKIYEQEMETLQETVNLYQQQYDKGNVPLTDLARLKAYLFNLNAEKQQILQNVADDEATLNILTNQRGQHFLPQGNASTGVVSELKIDALLVLANENRTDLNLSRTATKIENQNLTLQQALAKPDVNVQMNYDRGGSIVPNYLGLGVGMALPFFNRNQGNIEAAKVRVQSSQLLLQANELQVQQNVFTAYQKALQADKVYRTFDSHFTEDFSKLIDGVLVNYKKRNINVVEFIDFFDSYKSTVVQFNQLQSDRMKAFENLNYAVGKIIL